MTAAGKIQRAPRVRDGKKGGKRRLDGKAPSQNAEIPCAYAKCGRPFAPAKHNQRYCSDACRKRASFDRKFLRLEDDPHRELQVGDMIFLKCNVWAMTDDEQLILATHKEDGSSAFLTPSKLDLVVPAKEK